MHSNESPSSRRSFIKSASVAGAAAVTTSSVPSVHAANDGTLNIAFVGCGGRGTGAAVNALSVPHNNTKIVAMADVFENRLKGSYRSLKNRKGDKVDVPEDRQFVGFDGYKKAMDCLKPGDIVILTTPPAFRWVHFSYAIEKGLHVFMEKPVTVDGPTTRRMYELAKKADDQNLKCGVGLMVRHCRGRQELYKRLRNGEIGDLITMRACRMGGRFGNGMTGPRPSNLSELLYQVQRFHSFLWASGGIWSDFNIHQIDEVCWMKDAWPVKARGLGGRHYRGKEVDQNFDSYGVEYTFPDGTTYTFDGRYMNGCHSEFASYGLGTKGSCVISASAHTPGRVKTYKGHNMAKDDILWAYPQPEKNPYQLEWDDLIDAIVNDKPYNEVERGAKASVVTSMGRMAAHTGQIITYDAMLNCEHEMAPGLDNLTMDSPAPLQMVNGTYPQPMPGLKRTREY